MNNERNKKIEDLLTEHLASHEVRDKKEASRFDIFKHENEKFLREIDKRLEQAKKIRDELLSYALQIVSIIIGLFGLIMSIVFLIAYRDEMVEFQFWFLFSILIIFTVIFISWFVLWCWNKCKE